MAPRLGLTILCGLLLVAGNPEPPATDGTLSEIPPPAPEGSSLPRLTSGEDAAAIRYRRVGADGELGAVMTVAETNSGRSSGFPQMVLSPQGLVFAWTDAGPPSRIRTAVAQIPGG